jgi:predicted house-cleaning noncanonical NTP pyrophosphatase (MazG superfamily)
MKGNKGEWSEVYAFLKLISEGKLYAADKNLEKIPSLFFPIIKIVRRTIESNFSYALNGNVQIIDEKTKETLLTIPTKEFIIQANLLFQKITTAKGASFEFPELDSFFDKIKLKQLKAKSRDKSDIQIVIHDINSGLQPELGFSIKSFIGKNSTLFNAGAGTNFIYKISGDATKLDISNFNQQTILTKGKITNRINSLLEKGFALDFHEIQSENLHHNLLLIDADLPKILAELLLYKYQFKKSKIPDLLTLLNENNPLNYPSTTHPFYQYKLKRFLTDIALGMTPEATWKGNYDATGGIIVVKNNGEVLCYHIFNRNEFQEYLLTNTKLEQAATGEDKNNPGFSKAKSKPYRYGWVYEEDGELFLKLNLQIRFS